MKPVRVLVVDDSLTVRKRLCEILRSDAQIDVVGEAGDGREAIALGERLRPDVISLDMMMPAMSGLATTEYIMAHYPTPILIVSSSTNRGELFKTYEALYAGAIEAFEKPTADAEIGGQWANDYIALLKLVARIRPITHVRGRLTNGTTVKVHDDVKERVRPNMIALGASTGGPGALVEILRALPCAFAVPVVIVIHIGEPFAHAFADWLSDQSEHRVTFAKDGQHLNSAGVFLAPSERHLVVHQQRLRFSDEPPRHSCRPSVDVLFESIARDDGAHAAAALLTGMGQDGARGLLAIRSAGGVTIAQDEATSVVYGMSREAVLLGAAERVLPLGEIGPSLARLAMGEDP